MLVQDPDSGEDCQRVFSFHATSIVELFFLRCSTMLISVDCTYLYYISVKFPMSNLVTAVWIWQRHWLKTPCTRVTTTLAYSRSSPRLVLLHIVTEVMLWRWHVSQRFSMLECGLEMFGAQFLSLLAGQHWRTAKRPSGACDPKAKHLLKSPAIFHKHLTENPKQISSKNTKVCPY